VNLFSFIQLILMREASVVINFQLFQQYKNEVHYDALYCKLTLVIKSSLFIIIFNALL